MRADVQRELRLGRERHRAAVAVQRLVGHVRPSVCCYVALDGESFLTNVTGIRPFPCVRSFMYIECGLLRESLEANIALIRSFACVRAIMDLQVLLASEGGRAL